MTGKRYAIISLIIIIIMLSTLSGCNSCLGTNNNETQPATETNSTTLMPGYVDDGTTAATETSVSEEKTDKVFVPSGPFKDGDNSGYANPESGNSSQKEDTPEVDKDETVSVDKPVNTQASETKPPKTEVETASVESEAETTAKIEKTSAADISEPEEEKTSAQATASDETTEITSKTTDAAETEAEITDVDKTEADKTEAEITEADKTEPKPQETTASDKNEVTEEATDATEETTSGEEKPSSKPEYPVPGVPDDDIIGPLPPIDMDEFLDPDATVAIVSTASATVTATATAVASSAADNTFATVSTQVPPVTNFPFIPDVPETTVSAIATTAPVTSAQATMTTEVSEPASATEATNPTNISGKLEFSYYGSFTGEFVEDGTDEYVQNVAIIFVTNISESYLEYSVITFDIDGQVAVFTATGLAPGESAWVLEQNRLKVEKGVEFKYVDDASSFTEYVLPAESGINVTLGEGQLKAKNTTDKELKEVYVYYKQVHTDGNFLGGITYRVSIGDLKAGEEIDSVAMHSSPMNTKVVSVTYREEAN